MLCDVASAPPSTDFGSAAAPCAVVRIALSDFGLACLLDDAKRIGRVYCTAREAAQWQAHFSEASSGTTEANAEREARESLAAEHCGMESFLVPEVFFLAHTEQYLWLQQRDAWALGLTLYPVLTHELFPWQAVFLRESPSTGRTRARGWAQCHCG